MDPIGFCFRRIPSGDKVFSRFKKCRFQFRIWKVSKPFLEHNKMESKNNWTTFGSAFAVSSGDKTFSRFQKDRFHVQILKVSKPFLEHNQIERRLSIGAPSVLLSQSLRGIKHFQDFKKADLSCAF